jgi:hypothetical protein
VEALNYSSHESEKAKRVGMKLIQIASNSFTDSPVRRLLCLLVIAVGLAGSPCYPAAAPVPDDFPRFTVPGQEREMESLRALFWLHYEPSGPLIALWDEWMPPATLWPALGSGRDLETMRARWARALAARPMNAEGYVLTQQHDGPAHAEGWPFPLWSQAGGIGWHFRGTGVAGYDPPPATTNGWILQGGTAAEINDKGWPLELTNDSAVLEAPRFAVEASHAPWLRLNWWATGLANANCYLEWITKDQPEYSRARRAYFSPASLDGQYHSALPMGPQRAVELNTSVGETRTMIPVYRLPEWKGTITGLRIHFENPAGAKVVVKSFHTACDTRQNVNNVNFIRGCRHYFNWTRDLTFLRSQMPRVRTAMHYMMSEFDTRKRKCVYTTWPGHEGRSGVRMVDGKKQIIVGEGIGSDYWDLLPFGGEDALATVYYYDALLALAELEEGVLAHPEWAIGGGAETFGPADLRKHAAEVRDYGGHRFWNEKTGRLGTVDLDGALHDYGFTFLNNEAVYYGFATPSQTQSIRDWISGRRIIEGDTSTGADIYCWRFGPRSTTRRNLDYYFWAWSNPETIPWGYQVQDGGAVLGFSYHDLMARLMVEGADSAWARLQEIIKWFDETQAAGGYRAYYKDSSRGTMQGGNTAGGLGLDREFFESVMVPQIMIYGFLGLRPTAEGCSIDPKLPSGWTSLGISQIHLHDKVIEIKANSREKLISIVGKGISSQPLTIKLPQNWKLDCQSKELASAL